MTPRQERAHTGGSGAFIPRVKDTPRQLDGAHGHQDHVNRVQNANKCNHIVRHTNNTCFILNHTIGIR